MTEKQFERFTDIIKAIDNIASNKKNIFNKENMIITISDSKRFFITIKMKHYKGTYNKKYIKDLIISKLKEVEKDNKKLDFENKCGLDFRFEEKQIPTLKAGRSQKNKKARV